MRHDIRNYVLSCHDCQLRKIPGAKKYGKMQIFQVPEEPFSRVQIDIMGPFTRSSRGNKYVVTAIDYLTKWIEARAIKDATAETVAEFLTKQVVCRHSVP